MQVKFFRAANLKDLENALNEYLKKVSNENFVDIKYAATEDASEAVVITRTEVE